MEWLGRFRRPRLMPRSTKTKTTLSLACSTRRLPFQSIVAFTLLLLASSFGCKSESPRSKPKRNPKTLAPLSSPTDEKQKAPTRRDTLKKALEFLSRWQAAQNSGDFDEYSRMYAPHFRGIKRAGENSSTCLLYTSPSPRDGLLSRMPSSA